MIQTAPDVMSGQTWFDALAAGGTVINPYNKTFFSTGFGMVQDRVSSHWIISGEQTA